MSMAKTLMTWRWLAAAALLLAPALAFATGDAEQSAPASAGAGAAMSGRFSEAPMLAARVAAGELPPVQERIPVDPVVQEMLADGVGRYGGTLRVSEAVGFMNQRGGELTTQMLDIYLLTMHQETLDIVPNIAAGYAVADDGLTVTLELRPGTRWSNGDPFIVDDRPTAATIHSTARFYKPQWQWLWAEHDPEQAGRLLDEVGLTGRDRDGFRTFPDGSNLTIQVAARTGGPVTSASCSSWRSHSGRRSTCAWCRGWWTTPPGATTSRPTSSCCSRRHRRHHRVLELDQRRPRLRRRRPARRLQHDRQLRRVGALLRLAAPVPDWRDQRSLSGFGSGEWFELAQKMFDFTGDNVFVIGTVGEAPNILLTNNDLRNVPTEFPVSNTDWKGNLMYWADQLWLDR